MLVEELHVKTIGCLYLVSLIENNTVFLECMGAYSPDYIFYAQYKMRSAILRNHLKIK